MNNEETILDPQNKPEAQINESSKAEQPKEKEKKSLNWKEKAAYAAGGAVAGVGLTMAGEAYATPSDEMPAVPEEIEPETDPETEEESKEESKNEEVHGVTIEANGTTVHVAGDATVDIENGNVHVATGQAASEQQASTEQYEAPEPEDVIVATATGIRVAQVDDDASFAQAFADARAQVGPGGVFEWHGRVYNTFYKEEWDSMTPEQKQEYQASIDYDDIVSGNETSHAQNAHHSHHTAYQETASDNEVHVLEVGQADLNEDGIPEDVAVLDINGHEVIIVDIDRDGIADVAIADPNNDGEPDFANLVGEGVGMPGMSDGDLYLAQANNAPDYMNDANVGHFEA